MVYILSSLLGSNKNNSKGIQSLFNTAMLYGILIPLLLTKVDD